MTTISRQHTYKPIELTRVFSFSQLSRGIALSVTIEMDSSVSTPSRKVKTPGCFMVLSLAQPILTKGNFDVWALFVLSKRNRVTSSSFSSLFVPSESDQ